MFGTEQVYLLMFNSQVNQVSSFKPMFSSKTLRVPIAGYCLRLSSSVLETLGFLVKAKEYSHLTTGLNR